MIKGLLLQCLFSCCKCQRSSPQNIPVTELFELFQNKGMFLAMPHGFSLLETAPQRFEILCWDCARPIGRGGNESMDKWPVA